MTMQPNSNTCNCRFSFNLQPTNYSPKGNHLITDLYFFVCVSVCVCVCDFRELWISSLLLDNSQGKRCNL